MVNLNDQFDDGGNPYYLHQSDNPGIVFVLQPLTNDNYNSWRRSMVMALSAKNKLGFVDGSISAPPLIPAEKYNAWTRVNNLVNSWLLNAVSKEIAASLLYHSTAAEIWKDLEDRFQQMNGPRLFHLRKKIGELVQGTSSVTVYYTQLKILWDELMSAKSVCSCSTCTCGGVKKMIDDSQREQTIQFLMGLNDSFSHIRGQILLVDPFSALSKVFSWVVQEENQRSVLTSKPAIEAAFTVKAVSKKSRPQCSHCNMLGHTRDKCYKLNGYPSGYNVRSRPSHPHTAHSNVVKDSESLHVVPGESLTPHQCQQLIAMLSTQLQAASSLEIPSSSINLTMQGKILAYINSLHFSDSKSPWIIVLGASRHICYEKGLFESLTPITGGSILLPDKSVIPVQFSGIVRLSSSLVLNSVLFVPEFRFNLLAVSALVKNSDLRVLFCNSQCVIQDLQQVVGKGELFQGLYLLRLPDAPVHSLVAHVDSCEDSVCLASWHDRLGHPSSNVMHLLKSVVPSCNVNKVVSPCSVTSQKLA
ncbi:hypothetical protein HRI_004178500 [Hibiscus trionum]|uniref:Retrotransposon Copia-like N-terminal domain-containing protein n=1 Tax=Hibiscus trionum TaxID=183268 RepID=A0A9W7MI00_HIBTR|nr:hypothetical protein HRI_004178500 [Hibiscus trionum]